MKKDNDEIFTINFKISKKQIDQIGLAHAHLHHP